MRIAIIADDLTGAADCALQGRLAGFSARVVLDPAMAAADAGSGPVAPLPGDAQVIAFDTDSRALTPERAAARVARLGAALSTTPWDVLYKKLDSTLRGNIGAELAALAAATTPQLVVIAPAFPAAGRQVVNGQVLVEGRPLHTTDAGRDPSSPVRTSSVVERLQEQLGGPGDRPGGAVDGRSDPQPGAQLGEPVSLGAPGPDDAPETMGRKLVELCRAGRRAVVCDAASDADLAAIVRGVRASGLRVIWAGSAGLMAQLAAGDGEVLPVWPNDLDGGRVLVVAGSLHTRTRRQLARLCDVPGVGCVAVEAAGLLDPARRERSVAQALAHIRQATNGARHVALATRSEPGDLMRAQTAAAQLGVPAGDAGRQIASALAEIAAQARAEHGFERLVLTGGDIARAVCLRLGVRALDLEGALETGIPLARGMGGDARPLWFVTKAGGFGGDDVLVRAVQRLGGEGQLL